MYTRWRAADALAAVRAAEFLQPHPIRGPTCVGGTGYMFFRRVQAGPEASWREIKLI